MKSLSVVAILTLFSGFSIAQERLPIIDVHLHATAGGFPAGICIPWVTQFPPHDDEVSWQEQWMESMMNPPCENPVWSPAKEGESVMQATIDILHRKNIIGVLSGPPDRVAEWVSAKSDRFIPSLEFSIGRDDYTVEDMRPYFEDGRFKLLGEVSSQYRGVAPDDERMYPFWALAEELEIPVAIHLGEGTNGTPFIGPYPNYRVRLSSPLVLEEVLIRHPKLRISVMHYGSPFVSEMIAMLGAYPQIYIDIGGIQWFYPKEYFYFQLKQFVDAGFSNRVMYGSDASDWPGLIDYSIEVIAEAPFLSQKQVRDILYNNAARFLRLTEAEIARHHMM